MLKSKLKKFLKRLLSILEKEKVIFIPKLIKENKLLDGKLALITGGSSGIGYEIAKEFIENGCKVIITGTKEAKLRECCNKLGENSKYLVWNVLDIKKNEERLEQALKLFPNKNIEILVNSAGVANKEEFFNISEEKFEEVININLKGTFFMSQVISKYMIKNKIRVIY